MKTKQILFLIALVLAVMITVSSALALTPLDITNVKVNNVDVLENGSSPTLKLLDTIELKFIAANNLTNAITNVKGELKFSTKTFLTTNPLNLNAGENGELTITGDVPLSLVEGSYPAQLKIEGKDYDNPATTYTDTFLFNLIVGQESRDVTIIPLTPSSLSQNPVDCGGSTILSVTLVNKGKNDEDDVNIKVTNNNGLNLLVSNFSINKNSQETKQFTIPAEKLNQGANTLNVDIDYVNGKNTDSDTINVEGEDCSLSFKSVSPTDNTLYLQETEGKKFSVDVNNPSIIPLTYAWYKNDVVILTETTSSYSMPAGFLPVNTASSIKVVVNEGSPDQISSPPWTVISADKPVDWQTFNGPATTNLDNVVDISKVGNFVLDNGFGKIEFTGDVNNNEVDLSEILKLADLVKIQDGIVSVDSNNLPANTNLEIGGKITLKKTFTNFQIQVSNDGINFTECTNKCTNAGNINGEFVFDVNGFSFYKVIELVPADFEISEILFADVDRNTDDVTTDFTVKNVGTNEKLSDLKIELVGVDSEYNAKFVGSLPTQLLSGQQESLTLQIDVPKDEDGGKHSIGLVKFTGKNENNEVITKEVGIYVQPKSYLLVDNIEVNGKSSGDLVMDDTNEIEFTITNDYDEDMDVSEIRVRLLDADGDEILDQEVDLEDKDMIKDGEEEDYSVELDLNGEKLSDEEYTLEITVEGEADDNTNHKTVETKTVGVDRKSHQVIISSAALTSSKLICSEYTTLHVTVENVGKNTEDDVEIRVKNSALNLDLKKTGIELEDYSSNDNDYKATFSLNVADAKAGTYTLDVELYRDGDLEETKKVELVIVGCSATESEEETVNDYSKLAAELQQKLNGYVDEKETTTVKGSFRESSTYTTLLGILVVLVFVAAVLSLALLFTKRR